MELEAFHFDWSVWPSGTQDLLVSTPPMLGFKAYKAIQPKRPTQVLESLTQFLMLVKRMLLTSSQATQRALEFILKKPRGPWIVLRKCLFII